MLNFIHPKKLSTLTTKEKIMNAMLKNKHFIEIPNIQTYQNNKKLNPISSSFSIFKQCWILTFYPIQNSFLHNWLLPNKISIHLSHEVFQTYFYSYFSFYLQKNLDLLLIFHFITHFPKFPLNSFNTQC